MSIYKKINGQDTKIASNGIVDHSQLTGRNAYGAHSIQAIRGLPEKLTANKKAIEDETTAREAAIEQEREERIQAIKDEADARALKDAEIEEHAKGINLSEGQNGTLIFKDYQGHETIVQGGYLPDDETIELQAFYSVIQLTEDTFIPDKYYIKEDESYVLANTWDDSETYYSRQDKMTAFALNTGDKILSGQSIDEDITSIKSIVNAKGGYLESYNVGKADPTQEELTQYAIQDIGENVYKELGTLTEEQFNGYVYLYTYDTQSETYTRIATYDSETIYYTVDIWDKTRVINLYTNKTTHKNQDTWSWDYNSQTWSNLRNISLISDANNEGLHGLVTGAPNDGEHDYLGNIDANGHIHINGLPQLADKVNNQIINSKSQASEDKAYSSQYIDNNFAPLSFVSRLYLNKVSSTAAELVNTAPTISPNNYLSASASIYPIDYTQSPLFTITRTLQADTTLNEETSFTTTLNFVVNRTCSLQFGARIKVSTDNGSTWTNIGSEQSFGQEDYSQDALSTTQFIAYTDLLNTNVSYPTGTLLTIEVYACLGDGDSTSTTIQIGCGIEKDSSNIYSYLQFNYQSVMISTDQIADGAITRNKLAQEVKDELDGKVNKTTTIAGVDLQDNITKNELLTALNVENGAQVNTVTGVKGNAESTYRTGNINITPDNLDDTNTTNKFVSQTNINNWNAKQDALSQGVGITITSNTINLNTNYASQSGIVEGSNSLNSNIVQAMNNKLPIIINGSILTFISDDGTTKTYGRDYEGTHYSLTSAGLYQITNLVVMTIHRP